MKNSVKDARKKMLVETKDILNECLAENISMPEYLRLREMSISKFSDFKKRNLDKWLEEDSITREDYEGFMELYTNCIINGRQKRIETVDVEGVEDYDDRSKTKEEREGDLIKCYSYSISTIDGLLEGKLSRDEMNHIYQSYSHKGFNSTQSIIARDFPMLTTKNFKKILRAFGITKDCAPFAPHVIEENTNDELIALECNIKTIGYQRYSENKKVDNIKTVNKKLSEELNDAKTKIKNINNFFENFSFEKSIKPLKLIKSTKDIGEETLMLYMSDWHVGCEVSDNSIYKNKYNEEELNKRITRILTQVEHLTIQRGRKFKKIVVCNLGDSLDGYNGDTTRGGHHLPQNMNNRQQFDVFVKTLLSFIESLYQMDVAHSIEYYCVGDSNHDGDFGYIANKCAEMVMQERYPNMITRIFNKNLDYFKVENQVFILTHGKDSRNMFKGYPLHMNRDIKDRIHEYLDEHRIFTPYVHFIKGDLHQSASERTRKFRYRNVSSIMGSSEWIHDNFGNTKAALDYDIIHTNPEAGVLEGRILLN